MVGREPLLHFVEHLVQSPLQIVINCFLVANLGEDLGVSVLSKAVELILELAAQFNRDVVEVRIPAGVDNQDLLFNGQRP